MNLVILANISEYKQHVNEAKQAWIDDVLNGIGVDTAKLGCMSRDSVIEYLIGKKIDIVHIATNEGVRIMHDGTVIGEWLSPTYIIKRDVDGQLYYEIKTNARSILNDKSNS